MDNKKIKLKKVLHGHEREKAATKAGDWEGRGKLGHFLNVPISHKGNACTDRDTVVARGHNQISIFRESSHVIEVI